MWQKTVTGLGLIKYSGFVRKVKYFSTFVAGKSFTTSSS